MKHFLIDTAQDIDVAEENVTSKFMSCVSKCVPEKLYVPATRQTSVWLCYAEVVYGPKPYEPRMTPIG